ncbi:MAG: hypothetical protein NUV84_03975 [Candidatus Uhrbacteria bacterium]|nr:hypothetical protein [Candidatus Uhrbacteria bacterium]
MTREELVKLIEHSQLEEATKRELLNLIIDKGLTREVVDKIKESFDDAVIATMKSAGVDLTQTAEFKAAEAEFAAEAEVAGKQLESEMAAINKEMKQAQDDTAKQLDDLQAQVIKDKIS